MLCTRWSYVIIKVLLFQVKRLLDYSPGILYLHTNTHTLSVCCV
jgi:hypothetical protein